MESGSKYVYVDNAEELSRLTEAMGGTVRVALDTEADSLHHYFEKVCLIQLAFSGTSYVVDPLAGLSLAEFLEALSQKELILQGADYDLRMLKQSFEFLPKAPVFDTMLAAQVLGLEKIGLAALVEKYCGVLLTKSGQKSDWSRRPLSEKLLDYASDDVKYLERVADAMAEELRGLGRTDWHRECCERVVRTSALPSKNDPEEAWRIKGSSKLPPSTLVFVRELWKWRDEEARQRDRPVFMTMLNENLIELAEWRAQNPQEPLQAGPAFLKRIGGDKLSRLESAVRSAENTPQSQWPEPLKKIKRFGEKPSEEKVEALLAASKTIAEGLRISPSVLASRASVTAVIRNQPRTIEAMTERCGLMRWQAELLMPALSRMPSEG